jgi:hypothetical protein
VPVYRGHRVPASRATPIDSLPQEAGLPAEKEPLFAYAPLFPHHAPATRPKPPSALPAAAPTPPVCAMLPDILFGYYFLEDVRFVNRNRSPRTLVLFHMPETRVIHRIIHIIPRIVHQFTRYRRFSKPRTTWFSSFSTDFRPDREIFTHIVHIIHRSVVKNLSPFPKRRHSTSRLLPCGFHTFFGGFVDKFVHNRDHGWRNGL